MSASHHTTRAVRSHIAQKLKTFEPKLTYRALPATKEVEITLTMSETWGPIASEVLGFMDQMVQSVGRYSRAGFRALRTADVLAEMEFKYNIVRQRYAELRAAGVKHSKAVQALVNDQALPFYGRFDSSDYNWCVKSLPVRPGLAVVKRK